MGREGGPPLGEEMKWDICAIYKRLALLNRSVPSKLDGLTTDSSSLFTDQVESGLECRIEPESSLVNSSIDFID